MATLSTKKPIKTYTRQQKTQPKLAVCEEPPPKRRRIDDYFKRVAAPEPEKNAAAESEEVAPYAPSSSPKSEIPIFSDQAPTSTPPSSPPALSSSPIARLRKPTFSFLTRNDAAGRRREPLAERSGNAQKKPEKKALTQMKIDLGEETRKACEECGMEYLPSNEEDMAVHKKFHASSMGAMNFKKAFLHQAKSNRIWENGTGTCIIAVSRNDGTAMRRKALDALEIVNSELGAVPIAEEELWSPAKAESAGKPTKSKSDARPDRFKMFLYVHDQQCIGLCLTERISRAHRVLAPELADDARDGASPGKGSSLSVSDDAERVLMGISRVWTSRAHRKMGVARTLLDTAVDNFLYGMEVPKDQVAFSQPTESGGILARKWFGKEHGWHVYVE